MIKFKKNPIHLEGGKTLISASDLANLPHELHLPHFDSEQRKKNREGHMSVQGRMNKLDRLPTCQKLLDIAEIFGLDAKEAKAVSIYVLVDSGRLEEIQKQG